MHTGAKCWMTRGSGCAADELLVDRSGSGRCGLCGAGVQTRAARLHVAEIDGESSYPRITDIYRMLLLW